MPFARRCRPLPVRWSVHSCRAVRSGLSESRGAECIQDVSHRNHTPSMMASINLPCPLYQFCEGQGLQGFVVGASGADFAGALKGKVVGGKVRFPFVFQGVFAVPDDKLPHFGAVFFPGFPVGIGGIVHPALPVAGVHCPIPQETVCSRRCLSVAWAGKLIQTVAIHTELASNRLFIFDICNVLDDLNKERG